MLRQSTYFMLCKQKRGNPAIYYSFVDRSIITTSISVHPSVIVIIYFVTCYKCSSFRNSNNIFCYIETVINSSYNGLYVKFFYYNKYLSHYLNLCCVVLRATLHLFFLFQVTIKKCKFIEW